MSQISILWQKSINAMINHFSKHQMKYLYLVVMLSAFTFTDCNTSKKSTPDTSMNSPLLSTDWKLVELNGHKIVNPIPNQKLADIKLMPEGSRLVGSGGCNSMMGVFELEEKNRLKFSGIAMTKMACPDMSIETQLSIALSETNKFAINGKTLMLLKGKKPPLAKFEAQ